MGSGLGVGAGPGVGPGGVLHLAGPILGERVEPEAWVVDGRITLQRPPGAAAQVAGYVVPGLVDAHCHIGLADAGATDLAAAEAHAVADRDTGVLLIREPGNVMDTHWTEPRADLPRIIRAGRHIARLGRYLRGFAVDVADPGGLPAEMARQARAGDGWVKIVADWIDRSMGADAVVAPLWPAEVLRDGIAAAHEAGARVMAHAFSHAAITPLLDAGVDSIEHGTGMDADHIAEAAARGIPVTPTLLQVENFAAFAAAAGGKYPAYAAQMQEMYDRREAQIRAFWEAGIQLLPGSDAGGAIEHGRLPEELALWQRAGIPSAETVAFASWRARAFLGRPSLEESAPADLVVYRDDPRVDVAVLWQPAAVMLAGKLIAARA